MTCLCRGESKSISVQSYSSLSDYHICGDRGPIVTTFVLHRQVN
jgi:hypothetical protein